jgi:hypothetical protein
VAAETTVLKSFMITIEVFSVEERYNLIDRSAKMEFYYQALVEYWVKIIWTITGIISLLIAYKYEDQSLAWKTSLGVFLVTCVAAVPDWPIYKRHRIIFRGIDTEKLIESESKSKRS